MNKQQLKQDTLEIVKELLPNICSEEIDIFEMYSESLYEQAIADLGNNKLGDSSYFGESNELIIHVLIPLAVGLLQDGIKKAGKYTWQQLYENYQKLVRSDKLKINADLQKKIDVAVKQKSEQEKLNDRKDRKY